MKLITFPFEKQVRKQFFIYKTEHCIIWSVLKFVEKQVIEDNN